MRFFLFLLTLGGVASSTEPTLSPTTSPTLSPTSAAPSEAPSAAPNTEAPSQAPSAAPNTQAPSTAPSTAPNTQAPSTAPSAAPNTVAPSTAPSEAPSSPTSSAPSAQPTSTKPSAAPTTHAPTSTPYICVAQDIVNFTISLSNCNSTSNSTVVARAENITRSIIDPGNTLSLNVTVGAAAPTLIVFGGTTCNFRVNVTHPSGSWNCSSLTKLLSPASIRGAVSNFTGYTNTSVNATQATIIKYVPPPTPAADINTLGFNPYAIIIPVAIVSILFDIWLRRCSQPRTPKRQSDEFEMGEAQRLESSNLGFTTPLESPKDTSPK